MGTPYSQVMMEWDAAQFNDYVKQHDKAMASIDNALARTSGSKGADAAKDRRKLTSSRRDAIQEYHARSTLFWQGKEL